MPEALFAVAGCGAVSATREPVVLLAEPELALPHPAEINRPSATQIDDRYWELGMALQMLIQCFMSGHLTSQIR
jgi:hypothetical protein